MQTPAATECHVAMISFLLSSVLDTPDDMHASEPNISTWLRRLLDEIALPGLPQFSPATVAGISVAIIGNILISLALNCQKLAHRRLERERELQRAKNIGKDTNRRSNGINGNRQDTAHEFDEQEEDGELTPTGLPLRHVSSFHGLEEQSESQPLLPRSHSDAITTRRVPLFRRLFSWNKRRDSLEGYNHSLTPVDVVVDEPSSASIREASQAGRDSEDGNESDYLRSKLWWFGFTLMNIGEMGNFISYAFAPASVVAPLGTFALVANCVFAPVMLKEKFRKRDIFGIIIAIVGAVTVVLSANPSDTRLDPATLLRAISQKVFIVFSLIYIAAALVLSSLSESSIGTKHVFVDIGLCAIFGGFTVLSTKAISTLLTKEWFEIFTEWITYPIIAVLLGTGIGQIRYLNRALMRFDSKIVVPTQFVMFNLSAIVGSAILYGDFQRATFHQIVTFLYGCAATFAGVFIIAWAPSKYTMSDDEVEGPTPHDEDLETAPTNGFGPIIPRDVRLNSLSHRDRPTLFLPDEAANSIQGTSILKHRQSMIDLIGLSPAQRVLLVHTPRDEVARTLSHGNDDSSDLQRRRAVSWVGDGSPGWRGDRRVRSNVGSRDTSLNRSSQTGSPRATRITHFPP
ncbi:magnesium transporter NIPA-domain-containing protein [Irpex rosettiformis]|uniref:Magnesium transporter NIPA-domain-containing protein n=1 Tax=Irpex rosettiformis TaxID=378272 RepID=A0ACB8UFM1_9APHY|nr:magnesium transporter NIPA-domain-containing protein [Irpex rosettiformis]